MAVVSQSDVRRRRSGWGVWIALLLVVTAGALGHVAARMKGIEVAYELGQERRIGDQLEEQRRRLQIEVGMLKDPDRLVSIARDELGMAPPDPEAMRRIVLPTRPGRSTSGAH